MNFILRRGRQCICAPQPHDASAAFVPGLTLDADTTNAWRSTTIDQALERSALIRIVCGWATEVRAESTTTESFDDPC
jgi:hypothetical protein